MKIHSTLRETLPLSSPPSLSLFAHSAAVLCGITRRPNNLSHENGIYHRVIKICLLALFRRATSKVEFLLCEEPFTHAEQTR